MKNSMEMSMCIADVNGLLSKALREHVLKDGEYEVEDVRWDDRDMMFRIKLTPTADMPKMAKVLEV